MPPESSPDTELRPRALRVPATLAVELSSKEKPGRCGVTRNVSTTGLLLMTKSRFAVGDAVDLALRVGEHWDHVPARVVRIEESGPESIEVWRYRMAVAFDNQLSEALIEHVRLRGAGATIETSS